MPTARFGMERVPPPPTQFGSASPQQTPITVRAPISTLQPSLAGRGGGGKKPPRPSPDDRQKARVTEGSFKKADKSGRTRAGKKNIVELQALLGKSPQEIQQAFLADLQKNTPPRNLGIAGNAGAIYSGKWRGFEAIFEANWWALQGAAPWTCCICHAPILAGATGANARSIEHRQPWSVMKTGIATQTVCKDGVHWEVALTADVRAVLQDNSNLKPAHKGCNSSKGGSKDSDSIAPIKRGDCPGVGCAVSKAV
jgi:hypothetical protein